MRYANYINFSVPSLLPLACYIVANLLHNTTITRLNTHESIADFLLLYIVSALFREYHFADKKMRLARMHKPPCSDTQSL